MIDATARPTLKDRTVTTVTALAIIGGIFGAVNLLELKAAANKLEGRQQPLAVETDTLIRSDHYTAPITFTGAVEARQQSSLSFQVAGEIRAVLVDEGDRVTKGDVLAVLDTDRLDTTIAQLEADVAAREADLELAELTEKRQETLVSDGFTSKQRYDELRLATASAKARLAAGKAALKSARVDLARSALVAPFDGVVAARRADAGAVGLAGTPVLDLIETGATRARIAVMPEIAKALQVGEAVDLTLNGRRVSADVIAVRPDIDPITRSQTVLFNLASASSAATTTSFGDLVRYTVRQRIDEAGYWVPANTLRAGEKGLWLVYLLEGDLNEVSVRPEAVEILFAEEGRVYVRGNLPEGATLVASGLQRVAPGQRVRVLAKAPTAASQQQSR